MRAEGQRRRSNPLLGVRSRHVLSRPENVGVEEQDVIATGRIGISDKQASEERELLGRRRQDGRRLEGQVLGVLSIREPDVQPHECSVGSDPINRVLKRVGLAQRRNEHRGLTVEDSLRIKADVVPVHQARRWERTVARRGTRIDLVENRVQVEEHARLARRGVDPVNDARAVNGRWQARGPEVWIRIGPGASRDRVHSIAEDAARTSLDANLVATEGGHRSQLGHRRESRRAVGGWSRRDRDRSQVLIGRVGGRGEGRHIDRCWDKRGQKLPLFQLQQGLDLNLATLPPRRATRLRSGRVRHSVISSGGTRPS